MRLPKLSRPIAPRATFARGLALFFGAFSLVNAVGAFVAGNVSQDIWWIDLSALPVWLAVAFALVSAVLLVGWAVGGRTSRAWRIATAAACGLLALAAVANAVAFYRAWAAGSIAPLVPLPASALVGAGFAWLAAGVWRWDAPEAATAGALVQRLWAVGVAVVLALAFPVAQVAFFGSTDYRAPADVAVVLGARVYDNGVLTTSLEDRVRTAADLYRAGLVWKVIMSGAVEPNGIDEAVAMRDRAVALGVPASAVLMDHDGVDTDATVADTTAMMGKAGFRRVLVVSQFYHLPRIKLAYRAAGWDVRTVPATASQPIPQTPLYVLREVPAFWLYWARATLTR